MYDPTIGRFLSEDPSGFDAGDPNLYRYVGNDPVNHTDPTGLIQAGNPVQSLTGFGNGIFNPYAQSLGQSNGPLISPLPSSSRSVSSTANYTNASISYKPGGMQAARDFELNYGPRNTNGFGQVTEAQRIELAQVYTATWGQSRADTEASLPSWAQLMISKRRFQAADDLTKSPSASAITREQADASRFAILSNKAIQTSEEQDFVGKYRTKLLAQDPFALSNAAIGVMASLVGGSVPIRGVEPVEPFIQRSVPTEPLEFNVPRSSQTPTLKISASKYPGLAGNIYNAQMAGHPDVLTYGGNSVANRAAALKGVPNIPGLSRDEYPFASSMEGGAGSWVGHIPKPQQDAQGALLKNFYERYDIQPGDQFRVRVQK